MSRSSEEVQKEIDQILVLALQIEEKKQKLASEKKVIEDQEKLEAERKQIREMNERLKKSQDDEDFLSYSSLFFKYNGYYPDPPASTFPNESPQGRVME